MERCTDNNSVDSRVGELFAGYGNTTDGCTGDTHVFLRPGGIAGGRIVHGTDGIQLRSEDRGYSPHLCITRRHVGREHNIGVRVGERYPLAQCYGYVEERRHSRKNRERKGKVVFISVRAVADGKGDSNIPFISIQHDLTISGLLILNYRSDLLIAGRPSEIFGIGKSEIVSSVTDLIAQYQRIRVLGTSAFYCRIVKNLVCYKLYVVLNVIILTLHHNVFAALFVEAVSFFRSVLHNIGFVIIGSRCGLCRKEQNRSLDVIADPHP